MMSESSEVKMCLKEKHLKHLNRLAEKPRLSVEFQDLKYSVGDFREEKGWRQILNSISGNFLCGELTAIMGPSGAGKSTLLNILAGYVTSGVEGSININGTPRNMSTFKKMSSYIMQENIIQPFLSVREAMLYATSLKLGPDIKFKDKVAVVEEVISFLGLEKCANTRSEYLSGGQKKKLTIALELVNNPPVIFLDEPTTCLDDFAVTQCIDLLKKISSLDRTVVCTIHQPSSSLFQYFDQIYIMAEGSCVYSGNPEQLIQFFHSTGYDCPLNYTPADYMIELIHLHPTTIEVFRTANQNGKLFPIKNIEEEEEENIRNPFQEIADFNSERRSFREQFWLLLSRKFLQMRRNRVALYLQIILHVSSSLLVGGIFTGIGNDASEVVTILKYCLCCNVFFSYSYMMAPAVSYPFEIELLKREYFNHWYSLSAYYSVLTVSALPLLLILSPIYSTIVYFLTDQPIETGRFIGFTLVGLMVAMTAQGLGYMIGSVFNVMKGAIVGPFVLISFLVLSMYGVGQRMTITPFFKLVVKINFIRDGVVGMCSALFYKREPLHCEEPYCHYVRPELMMKDNSLPLMHYTYHLLNISVYLILFRVLWYFTLKYTLNIDLSSKLTRHVRSVMQMRRIFNNNV